MDLDMFSALLWQKLKNNVWPLGKIQAMLGATKEQRREYKAKFVDMDVEFARMRERLETMNLILDEIQVRNVNKQLSLFPQMTIITTLC